VLFARPRSNSVFLHDLENLKKKADEAEEFPPAVAALVTDPDTENPEPNLPVFRGVSATGIDSESGKASDLFFPKPFNDEQVRIIQLLEVSDTVVVQGPPGTGKTHTIANVICHYLASGKRVLVTSMKDPALAVLRHQLPDEIKPLAISLLSSEQEGMKQFEHSINKIASEVQSLDRSATHRAISEIEQNINILHSRIDRKIKEWAKISLSKIILDDEDIDPLDAAKEVVQYQNEENPIPDRLGIGSEFAPPLSDSDLVRLRNARRTLGEDIRYLGASMPQITEFPDPKTMLEVHQDLVTFEKLKRGIDNGETPQLADSSQVTIALAQQILDGISFLQNLRNQIQDSGSKWATEMRNRLRLGAVDEYLTMLEGVGKELSDAVETRREFIKRPVIAPIGMEKDSEFLDAIDNLISGKKPFGLLGIFGKSEQKKKLDEIRVLGSAPNDTDSWRHVSDFLALQNRLRELAVRWNALAGEVPVDILPGDSPDDGVSAADQYALYLKLKDLVKAEKNLVQGASQVFPTWEHVKEITDNEQYFAEFSQALKHHLLKNRLSNVWAHKERFQRILDRRSGRIINDIRSFLADSLGCQEVSDAALQTQWSDLMAELSRLHGLSGSVPP
jgi:DNA-directed RNA polymerase subunit L